jgi:glycosyltransferase involved in cell wall biosynthesis
LRLDIVIPIYNEEENLEELFRRLRETCNGLEGIDWRVIYVNDGSADRSLQIMLKQAQTDARFTIVDLSRNFGHQAAIAAGLRNSEGDAVILMDGDLQDPPELIPDLLASCGLREGAEKRQGCAVWALSFSIRPFLGSATSPCIRKAGSLVSWTCMSWKSSRDSPRKTDSFQG